MTKNVKKKIYQKHINGLSLYDLTLWLHETGYKKVTVKDKPAKVIELSFPM